MIGCMLYLKDKTMAGRVHAVRSMHVAADPVRTSRKFHPAMHRDRIPLVVSAAMVIACD
jgi:hypothetical protein